MKTPERFDKAVKALVQAFFNDHLAKWNCKACAVGNIVAYANGLKVDNIDYPGYWQQGCEIAKWSLVTAYNDVTGGYCHSNAVEVIGGIMGKTETPFSKAAILAYEAFTLIAKTGYEPQHLHKIEQAFEENTNIRFHLYSGIPKQDIMEDQFRGLMAVVEVLCKIDNIDPAPYKMKFEFNEKFEPVNSEI